MDKMRMESVDITDQNIEKIGALFPNVITEAKDENGKLTKGINFELLKQELSKEVVDGDEAYEFTWVGKKAAIVEANKAIRKTLRPCKEESSNWDTTENLYIEGDNIDVLKLLQENYLEKIKFIYIDPPYNTGKDSFTYPDDYSMEASEYDEETERIDSEGNVQFKENNSGNPRFHSRWCSMIYQRLLISRNLLSKDGIIFISIDNNELSSLKICCDEIYGQDNLVTIFAIENNPKGRKNNAFVAESFEYCLVYAKNKNFIRELLAKEDKKKYFSGLSTDMDSRAILHDAYGDFRQSKRQVSGTNKSNQLAKEAKADRRFTIYYLEDEDKMELLDEYDVNSDSWVTSEKGKELLANGYVRYCCINSKTMKPSIPLYSKETMYQLHGKHELYFKSDGTIYEKDRDISQQVNSFIPNKKYGLDLMTETATSKMEKLFGVKDIFTNSKAIDFIKMLVGLMPGDNFTCLDYFSGSATTAHAIMELNAEDNGKRKYIMVQYPEPCKKKDPAYLSGYKNICEIGKERIRRAAKKIHEEHPDAKFDDGFRVLKVDDSNMTDVYYSADSYNQNMLNQLESNIKPDRTDLDLLFGCLLEWGLPLSMPYISEDIEGCKVHTYNDGDLIACFDKNVPESVIKEIAKRKPLRAVFRDSSFKGSPEKINVGETFKLLSPDTRVKII